jgi:hypothetical protein
VQVLRGQAPNAAPMSLQYRVVALLIPTAVFGFGLYRYRSASKP